MLRAISVRRSFRFGVVCVTLFALFVAVSACGTRAAPESGAAPETTGTNEASAAPETTVAPETTIVPGTTVEAGDASSSGIVVEKEAVSTVRTQRRALEGCAQADLPPTSDTWSYARDYGVSREVADRRMDLQDCLSEDLYLLERKLKRNEGDAYAGLWAAHEPEYRFVVLFTEDGLQKIQPYIEDEQYAPLIEVRSGAEATHEELIAALNKAGRIVDRIGIQANSGLDITENRAEVYVIDRDRFRTELRRAGVRLPDHVAVVEVEKLL